MKRKYLLGFIIILSAFLSSCNSVDNGPFESLTGSTMGTSYNVQYINNSAVDKPSIEKEIKNILHSVDSRMSTWRSQSEVSSFNRLPVGEWLGISNDTLYVINLAQQISQQTKGAFDITVAPLVDLWGFSSNAPINTVPDKVSIQTTLLRTGYQHLVVNSEQRKIKKNIALKIDLSAIAKGYAVDKLADYLSRLGITSYLVEVGGELRVRGKNKNNTLWNIGIETPTQMTKSRTVYFGLALTDVAMATSGDYRNYFDHQGHRYSHTIDALTGKPVTHNLSSVTVVSHSSAYADALATALLVMGLEKGFEFCVSNNIAAYFIYKKDKGFAERFTHTFEPYIKRS